MESNYIITDLEEFINAARAMVFNSFGKDTTQPDDEEIHSMLTSIKDQDKEEFDKVLSYSESLLIAKQYIKTQKNKKDQSIRYILNERMFMNILESLNNRMISNILHKLATEGKIESAFDSEINDFVFWIKSDNKES